MKTAIMRLLLLLLLFYDHATSLIIPEDLPTILSLVYSNIPPIKKGTDSRLGVGFRLGEHADFQILVELGPQTETGPIGTSADAKRRRDAMLSAAMRGELGPLAQAVAKYQVQRRIHNEMDKLKAMEQKLRDIQADGKDPSPVDQIQSVSSNWLTKWKEMELADSAKSPKDDVPSSSVPSKNDRATQQRIERPTIKLSTTTRADTDRSGTDQLARLYKLQTVNNKTNLA